MTALGGNVHHIARPHPREELARCLETGLREVEHPGHPYYFMLPGGQVFTVAPA
jgi:hypothetical protein